MSLARQIVLAARPHGKPRLTDFRLEEAPIPTPDGRIRYREDFVDGLEKAPEAFIGMLEGRNFGKLIVRVDGGSKL
jgi:NADPH-dependent curcumin reductase CurA